ncbi:hypothetical protein [Streptomyces fuscichromogenes]|uniref:Lipoprotein n=1 Tax=Streptomyces fuscichromogenes TaxID=1324013 RepID=A0A917XJ81_9ACTN|nr:hypothetical protein [Streptomyces fuscichromogenes]GGN31015.1 lipoprotein [Streptomyces fuscichromogenes]
MRTSAEIQPFSRSTRRGGARHAISAALACGVLLAGTAACAGTDEHRSHVGAPGVNNPSAPGSSGPEAGPRLPGVGSRTGKRVPADAHQAVVVYGDDADSAESTVVLYEKQGTTWKRDGSWRAHNGRLGWTTDHRMDDERSPVGVFSLTDAGGSLRDPGSRLRYWYDDNAFASMIEDGDDHVHDFDYVIAIDYNRLKGVPPFDWSRPDGVEKGGGIWLHLDHGDGTSACVTVPESGMRTLLRTLDPRLHPVVVMGDRERLSA